MPQRELDVFRFVVLDDEQDVAADVGLSRDNEQNATPPTRVIVRSAAALRTTARVARSSMADLGVATTRVVRAPIVLRALGVVGSITLVVICIVVAVRYERMQPRAASPATRSVMTPVPAVALSRGERVRIQAAALIETVVDRTASVAPPYNGYLYDLPRSAAFERAWRSALSTVPAGQRASNAWLASLQATAAPNEAIETRSGKRYILAWGCDPAACAGRSVVIAYDASTEAVAATLYDGAWHTFGSAAIDDRATLLAQVACQQLGPGKRIPLGANDAAKAKQFIASASFE
jgi:hypothetical protein